MRREMINVKASHFSRPTFLFSRYMHPFTSAIPSFMPFTNPFPPDTKNYQQSFDYSFLFSNITVPP